MESQGNERQRSPREERLRARYGPWAVVTGASEGIGRAIARELAEAGIHLVLVARRGEVLAELASDFGCFGIETRIIAVDLAAPRGYEAVIADTADLDVGLLVASAGYGSTGPFVDSDLDTELGMIDLNCRALAALSHHFARRLVARKRGGLILLSSVLAFQGVPRVANYSATKAYVQSLAEGLHVELAPFGVDVLASAPGPTKSGFSQRSGMKMADAALSPTVVARVTLAALGRRSTIRPGWLSKLIEAPLKLLPRNGRVRMMGFAIHGMTLGPNEATTRSETPRR